MRTFQQTPWRILESAEKVSTESAGRCARTNHAALRRCGRTIDLDDSSKQSRWMVEVTLVWSKIGGNEVTDIQGEQTKALSEVAAAGADVQAAKRGHSIASVARAELQLHAAVDLARELDVEWGRIGSALGIARGCAYQRYRKTCGRRAANAA
jgi:hypothetical protein